MVRGDTYLKEEIVKIRMAQFYNCKVKDRPLRQGDLVLRKMKTIGKVAFTRNSHPIRKAYTWSLREYTLGRLDSQPFKEKRYREHGTSTNLDSTTYDVGRR